MILISCVHNLIERNKVKLLLIPFSLIYSLFKFNSLQHLTYNDQSNVGRSFLIFFFKILCWYILLSVLSDDVTNYLIKLLLVWFDGNDGFLVCNVAFKYVPYLILAHQLDRKSFKLERISNINEVSLFVQERLDEHIESLRSCE